MPARKPTGLVTRHDTNDDRTQRTEAESAMQPATELTVQPPSALRGHRTAREHWKQIVSLYGETEATIVTAFDQDLLINYCLAVEEAWVDLPRLKKSAWLTYRSIEGKIKIVEDEDTLLELTKELVKLFKEIKAIDARLDVKRKMLHTLQQSLYLTPRARAGVAPPAKEPEEPQDEMGALLDE